MMAAMLLDPTVHERVVLALFAAAVATALILVFVSAPYGRHARSGWGPTIPPRLGWVLMELPASVGFLVFYLLGEDRLAPAPLALLALWQLHYVYRTFAFPLRMQPGGRPMPALIPLIAVGFNTANAYANGLQIAHFGDYPTSWLTDPRFLVGAGVFLAGLVINRQADATLRSLRAPGETGYRVPRGGLYRYISCPNYFGEILQWLGWAIATWSLAGLAFAVYTAANLAPRARTNHAWYRETFPEYPPERRALLPWLW